jgi:uncharacterized protein (DUF2252 family)
VTSVAERLADGKAARARAPRSSHAAWEPPSDRDAVRALEEESATRVPELVPIRHSRMASSAFAFFRGAASIMARDLAATPLSGIRVQLCGDAHLLNFGGFASPDRALVFDLNDFDETLPGPWEWDVKRLASSVAIASRERGLGPRQRIELTRECAGMYREAMSTFARARALDVWYARFDERQVSELRTQIGGKAGRRLAAVGAKARFKDSARAFAKLAYRQNGDPRIASDPPLITPIEEVARGADGRLLREAIEAIIARYRETLPHDRRRLLDRYRYVHAARKVVGVGSVGTRAWVLLLLGTDDDDPLFLQAKEAEASVLEPYAGASEFANNGQRVVEGQRLMQAASDILLGWLRAPGVDGVERDFYVRQLWDWKVSADVERMAPRALRVYAGLCAWTLARAHARTGDAAAIAGYLGSGSRFDEAIARFAEAYADQNERDYGALREAIRSGRLAALPEP